MLHLLLNNLSVEDKARLMEAFEDIKPAYVTLDDGEIFGVHLDLIPGFICLEKKGSWARGKLNG